MRIAQEEISGPVLSIMPYETIDQAIEIANGSVYSLAGYVHENTDWLARSRGHGISISPCVLRPHSRGLVKLRSADPKDSAHFAANALTASRDVDALVRGVELSLKILEASFLARLITRRVMPSPDVEREPEALRDYIRSVAKTVFHPAGSCKMGPPSDAMAVIDEELRVYGVDKLRVCDASIMPVLVSGNMNGPTMMIAERAARFTTERRAV